MWTIFNSQNKPLANCDYEPNQEELSIRGEQAIYHEYLVPLDEARLIDGIVDFKPLVTLRAEIVNHIAKITVECDDSTISTIPLLIAGVLVLKPVGSFTLVGEPELNVIIDFDKDSFRGNTLEVKFGA